MSRIIAPIALTIYCIIIITCSNTPSSYTFASETHPTIGMSYGYYNGLIEIPSDFPYTGEFNLKVHHSNGTKNQIAICKAKIEAPLGEKEKKISFDLADLSIPLYEKSDQYHVSEISFRSQKWEAFPIQ